MEDVVENFLEAVQNDQGSSSYSLLDLYKALFVSPYNDVISLAFILLIIYIFASSIFPKLPFGSTLGKNAISTLPAIGILGTFIGVLVAVSKFKASPDNITQDLNNIIQGLKIAFATSIYGLGGSVLLRFIDKNSSSEVAEVGPEDILSAIQKGTAQANENGKKLIESISGEADGSLNNQLRLMRQDLNDFAKTVAEANTTAFIDALERAIADFNQNLTEQFGENFAKLNDAVGKLLEWQENNKRDMESLRDTLDEFVKAAKSSSESLKAVEEATSSIPQNMESLSGLLQKLDGQIENMEAHLEVFAEVSEKASNAMPEIKEVLEEYTSGLRNAMAGILGQVEEIVTSQESSFDSLNENYQNLAASINSMGVQIEETFETVGTKLTESINEASENINGSISSSAEQITTTFEGVASVIKEAGTEAGESIANASTEIVEQNKAAVEQHADLVQTTISALEEKIESITTEATRNISELTATVSEQIGELVEESVKTATGILEEHRGASADLRERLFGVIEDFSRDFTLKLSESNATQNEAIQEFSRRLQESFEGHQDRIQGSLDEHLNRMQESVDAALEREMQELASRLGAISQRIGEDYGALTDNIRRIVELGNEYQSRDGQE
jgi:chromosome segregation ATPase